MSGTTEDTEYTEGVGGVKALEACRADWIGVRVLRVFRGSELTRPVAETVSEDGVSRWGCAAVSGTTENTEYTEGVGA